MKLNAKQKKILEELVKTKGSFKTATINKNDTEKGFDDIVLMLNVKRKNIYKCIMAVE